MEARVEDVPVQPVVPEQRVLLDLSVEEFALIYALHYRYNGGNTAVRHSVSDGLTAALGALSEPHRAKVREAAPHSSRGVYPSESVTKVFG